MDATPQRDVNVPVYFAFLHVPLRSHPLKGPLLHAPAHGRTSEDKVIDILVASNSRFPYTKNLNRSFHWCARREVAGATQAAGLQRDIPSP